VVCAVAAARAQLVIKFLSQQFMGDETVTAPKMPPAQASPRVASLRGDEVLDVVRRRSVSLYAKTRVAEAIRALALDICADDSLSDNDRSWLRKAIASPVNEATEEALRVLVDELTTALRLAPTRVRPSVVAPRVTRVDFE
jgi:hypothetical protein